MSPVDTLFTMYFGSAHLFPTMDYTLTQADIISHLDPCGHTTPECLASSPTPLFIIWSAAEVTL